MKVLARKGDGDILICSDAIEANTFKERLVGLMFSSDLPRGDGLLLSPCNSIHTFFMRYDIDVVFLDSKNTVIKILRAMKPWRITRMYFKASKVLELKGNRLDHRIIEGDQLVIENV